jgi:NAD(P)-dependent dehydrogenase (short-subunit alcohol dehydrogenase family)
MELYPEEKTQGLAVQPMKRFGTPEEVANVVTFVLSKDASYINGADLMIDGALHSRYA